MRRPLLALMAAGVLGGAIWVGVVEAQDRPDGPPPRDGRGPGGSGGPGGGFHLVPRHIEDQLTPEQHKQLSDLEKEVREKLAKILTPEQQKALDEPRPPRRGGPEGNRADSERGGPGQGGEGERPRGPRRGGDRGGERGGPPPQIQ